VSPLVTVAVKVTELPLLDGLPELDTLIVGVAALTVKLCVLPVTAV
jgi:hypothetical protein